ncbi:MAG TPA: serine--tRNA ligase [Candidatus Nanoarchaeia archaeon]|nr:serine--tRNA ligase [Candidatus Nanoarchaeia archaeon]
MLDIKWVRENPEIVSKNLEKRQDADRLKAFNQFAKDDKEWRELNVKVERLRAERNEISRKVNLLMKEGKDAHSLIQEAKKIPDKIAQLEERTKELKIKNELFVSRLPNILHESVPYGKDEADNKVVRKWGRIPNPKFEILNHGELIEKKGLANFDDAAKVSGKGFYYLLGDFALLEMALARFAVDTLVKKGFKLTQVPLMLRREPYAGVTDLADFENVMYKIENEDLYLIATSEHPMAAMYMGHIVKEEELPVKLVGVSPCFRKEIGSHGVDEKGLFRVHQFNKVEQFVFSKPEESWKIHEELIANAEEIFQKLKLPYRVVNICTGDIGIVAAKKYDIEVWMPREKDYKEVVSCSNCTEYQAVGLNTKYWKEGKREYVHTLNSTAVADRALRAIIENYQQKDGSIKVPSVLVKYMNGKKVI